MKKIFKNSDIKSRYIPKCRGAYGIPVGTFVGEIFCFVEQKNDNYYFLSIPKMEKRVVSHKKFEFGIKNNIIEFIEILPKKVYKVIEAQYRIIEK